MRKCSRARFAKARPPRRNDVRTNNQSYKLSDGRQRVCALHLLKESQARFPLENSFPFFFPITSCSIPRISSLPFLAARKQSRSINKQGSHPPPPRPPRAGGAKLLLLAALHRKSLCKHGLFIDVVPRHPRRRNRPLEPFSPFDGVPFIPAERERRSLPDPFQLGPLPHLDRHREPQPCVRPLLCSETFPRDRSLPFRRELNKSPVIIVREAILFTVAGKRLKMTIH